MAPLLRSGATPTYCRRRWWVTKSLSQNRPQRGGPSQGGWCPAHFAPKTPHDHRGDGARPVPDGSGISTKCEWDGAGVSVQGQAARRLSYRRKGSVFTRSGRLATVPAMTNLLTFLGAIFYVGMAVIIAVAMIEHWRAARRQATELAAEEHVQKAA